MPEYHFLKFENREVDGASYTWSPATEAEVRQRVSKDFSRLDEGQADFLERHRVSLSKCLRPSPISIFLPLPLTYSLGSLLDDHLTKSLTVTISPSSIPW